MIPRIDLAAQYDAYSEEIDAAVKRVLSSGRYVLGDEVIKFEEEFSGYLGRGRTVALGDATKALTLALRALELEQDAEVITTPFTAVPTIGAIIDAGAKPVLVDIDPATWLMSTQAALEAITPRTAAIMPVHMFGNVFDVPDLQRRLPRAIPIIEDAAQAHGSTLSGKKAGILGDMGAFSFYPSKNLGALGDAGALVFQNEHLAERVRRIRNHGMRDKDVCVEPGINSRMDEIQAAILRVKLAKLDIMNEARARIAARYTTALPKSLFTPQQITNGATSNWHIYQCRYKGDRNKLVKELEDRGVQTNIYYVVPHHRQPAFKYLGYNAGDFPEIECLCESAIALPMYPELPEAVQAKVIEAILDVVE
jgi:dTDP-4-amino-4,6-dideoxygalactose transaminase